MSALPILMLLAACDAGPDVGAPPSKAVREAPYLPFLTVDGLEALTAPRETPEGEERAAFDARVDALRARAARLRRSGL